MVLKRSSETRVHVGVELAHAMQSKLSMRWLLWLRLGPEELSGPRIGAALVSSRLRAREIVAREVSRFLRRVKLNDGFVTKSENSLCRDCDHAQPKVKSSETGRTVSLHCAPPCRVRHTSSSVLVVGRRAALGWW